MGALNAGARKQGAPLLSDQSGLGFVEYVLMAFLATVLSVGSLLAWTEDAGCRLVQVSEAGRSGTVTTECGELAAVAVTNTPVTVNQSGISGSCSPDVIFTNEAATAVGPLAVSVTGTYEIGNCTNTCAGTTIAPSGTCSVAVRGVATTGGSLSGMLSITTNGTTLLNQPLGGIASGFTPPVLAAQTPTTIIDHIGPVPGGCSAPLVFENTGGAGSSTILTSISGGYELTGCSNTCNGASLNPGQTCEISVRSIPSGNGPITGTVRISASYGGSAQVSVAGTASGI